MRNFTSESLHHKYIAISVTNYKRVVYHPPSGVFR